MREEMFKFVVIACFLFISLVTCKPSPAIMKTETEMIQLVLTMYNQKSDSNNMVKLMEVKSISEKLAPLRKLAIIICETNCIKGNESITSFEDLQMKCIFKIDATPVFCNAELHMNKVTNLECHANHTLETASTEHIDAENFEKKLLSAYNSIQLYNLIHSNELEVQKQWRSFKTFMITNNRWYKTEQEFLKRYEIFQMNMKTAELLQNTEQGTAIYGQTMFSDLTPTEFRKFYLSPSWKRNANYPTRKAVVPNVKLAEDWDWRRLNAVSEVKNQKTCGSCWAFATTANVEGVWAVKKKKLVSLSEQELVDCDKLDEGCNGGLPSNAYKEIIRLGGLESEEDYSYSGHDEKCRFEKSKVQVYINDSVALSEDEDEIAAYVQQNGPVAIGINAFAMMFYRHGISHPLKLFCSPEALDHGVAIVGFGTEGTGYFEKPYWIIKNSWSTRWGESGYYRLYRGKGVCGVNRMVTSVIVE